MSDAIPVTLGRYVIHDEIGRGMMGRVYRAFDPELGRTIALKTIRLAFSASAEEQEQFERRFLAEARAAAILSHPNIVIVFDVGRDPDTNMAYIALEYLAGQTLEQMVAQGPLDWREACRIAARIADGLHHAHTAGIVHRDVKPANIVVLPSGVPKIMDFGIAKIPSAKLTLSGQFFGTPAYMSPEQIEGRDLDGRSDLFSLGAMLYLLLTGSRAFAGSSIPSIVACVQGQDPPMPSEVVAGIPAAVDLVVLRALAKDPAARYPDGRSFAEDLDDVREDRPPRHRLIVNAAPAVPAPEPAPAPLTSTAHEAATPPATASDPQSLPAPVIANDTRATAPSSSSAAPVPPPARRKTARLALIACTVLLWIAAGLVGVWYRWVKPAHTSSPSAVTPSPNPTPSLETTPASTPTLATGEPARPDIPVSTPAPSPTIARIAGAQMEIAIEHPLKSGRMRVWVSEDLAVDQRLTSWSKKRSLTFKTRQGVSRSLDIAPGERTVRVRIDWDDTMQEETIRGRFESGRTRRLAVKLGGLLKKRISLYWEDAN